MDLLKTIVIVFKDSILDLVTSLGVPNDQLIAAVPTFALQFKLSDTSKNTPKSPALESPTYISFGQVIQLLF